jgi:hypothetical protein
MTAMDWLRYHFPDIWPPVPVETEWGPVTESARKQAAINMRLDAEKRAAVEDLLVKRMGFADRPVNVWEWMKWKWAPRWIVTRWPVRTRKVSLGMEEARRRFPEAYRGRGHGR